MKQIVLDTNVIVRFLLQDVPSQYREAEKIFKKAKEGKIKLQVPQIVIFEIQHTLEKFYNLGRSDVADNLKVVVSAEYLEIQDKEIFTEALQLFLDTKLSLTDCFLRCKANLIGAELFTFDKGLSKTK